MNIATSSRLIPVEVATVWDFFLDFAGIFRIIPGAKSGSLLMQEAPLSIKRVIYLETGVEIEERLVAFDDEKKRLSYTMERPVREEIHFFLGSIRVDEGAQPDTSNVTWSISFETEPTLVSSTQSAYESRLASFLTKLEELLL
jgi:Polyketide cyclase / dehydrase and lipid transport